MYTSDDITPRTREHIESRTYSYNSPRPTKELAAKIVGQSFGCGQNQLLQLNQMFSTDYSRFQLAVC